MAEQFAARFDGFSIGSNDLTQAPSTFPEFAAFLVAHGIDSISVTLESFLEVKRVVARAEQASAGAPARSEALSPRA
jgi:pyruvate,water dikinase